VLQIFYNGENYKNPLFQKIKFFSISIPNHHNMNVVSYPYRYYYLLW